ncbi:MAG: hypothetical protein ACI9Y1_002452 [Lentisphaeria bacterium]|jgi:hypothetical protein
MDLSGSPSALSYTTLPTQAKRVGAPQQHNNKEEASRTPQGNDAPHSQLNSPTTNGSHAQDLNQPSAQVRAVGEFERIANQARRPSTLLSSNDRPVSKNTLARELDATEMRKFIVQQNNSPAARAFLEIAHPKSSFQTIDVYV